MIMPTGILDTACPVQYVWAMLTDNEWITLAQDVLRALNKGQEPYAPAIASTVAQLMTRDERSELLQTLHGVADELRKTAWQGSAEYAPYGRLLDVIDRVEAL